MDENANKALAIGAAVFITIAIASGAIYSIEQIKQIYKQVYETDTSLSNRFSEFDQYVNTEKSYVDVINTIKKYSNRSDVRVFVNGKEKSINDVKDLTEEEIIDNANKMYRSTVNEEEAKDTGIFKIYFSN